MDQRLEDEVRRRLRAIRNDRQRLMRYDINGDGVIDGVEWEEVRRVITAEIQTEWRRNASAETAHQPSFGPERLGQFQTIALLGRGGQGWTYKARHLDTGQIVALKELDLSQSRDWKAVELFDREAAVLQSLHHQAIPAYIDAFHLGEEGADERFFLAQEFVDGHNFDALLDEGLRFDETQARAFLDEMLSILDYLHGFRPSVIHRDIKPSNIIRRPDGRLALIDFGAVQALSPDTAAASTIVGTSGYMPLEQLMGRTAPASDLYALAATTVHLLTHRHPGDLPVQEMALQFHDYLNISPRLTTILEAMLAPHIEDRIQSASQAQDLLHGRASLPAGNTPPNSTDVESSDRPANLRSRVEPFDEGIYIEFPPNSDADTRQAGILANLGGPFVALLMVGVGAIMTNIILIVLAPLVLLIFLIIGRHLRQITSPALAISINGNQTILTLKRPNQEKVLEIPTKNLGPLRIITLPSRGQYYVARHELALQWKAPENSSTYHKEFSRPLRFGRQLSTDEMRYVIDQYERTLRRLRRY